MPCGPGLHTRGAVLRQAALVRVLGDEVEEVAAVAALHDQGHHVVVLSKPFRGRYEA